MNNNPQTLGSKKSTGGKPALPPFSVEIDSPRQDKQGLPFALAAVRKQFGEGSLFRLGGAEKRMDVQVASTGNPVIDFATGVDGLPRGRIVEIYGPESSGKTTLCLQVIAEAQRRGEVCAFIDVEHALSPTFARIIGVNLEELLVSQPDNGEQALSIMETLIKSGAISVVVLDSVAALISKNELEGQEMGDATMGSQARLMSQAMRRLTAVVSNSKAIAIFTNQIREKIGVMFGSPETQPGGRALKFFASMRIDVRRKDGIKNSEGVLVGNRVRAKFVKNKVAAPFTECEFDILYSEGVSRWASLLDLGLQHSVLEKKGAWIAYQGELLGQGRDAAIALLKSKPDVCSAILTAIRDSRETAKCTNTQPVVPPLPEDPEVTLTSEVAATV